MSEVQFLVVQNLDNDQVSSRGFLTTNLFIHSNQYLTFFLKHSPYDKVSEIKANNIYL